MSDNVIQLLPEQVINQIAAGEVIQRPASVIKELVENAIDAGADRIDIVVKDAGRTLIQVVDNGKGMSKDDAVLAFERHATSKIRTADDLFNLHTMGFRGEALASIAAIAHIELKTRRADDELGCCLQLTGGKQESCSSVSCPVGSNFRIRDLFFNVPARRKFLKSEETEMRNILQTFMQIALVYEKIAFSLTHNDRPVFMLQKGSRKQRIVDLMGERIGNRLLSMSEETQMVNISGFVGLPECAQKKGGHQFFFVNGRYIQHPYFNRAIAMAYEKLIPSDCKPAYFVYFEVPPENLDVNIHPTKTEVKFADEQTIFPILTAIVRETLCKANVAPSIDFDQEDAPEIPVFPKDQPPFEPTISVNTQYNPFRDAGGTGSGHTYTKKTIVDSWEELYKAKSSGAEEPQAAPLSGGMEETFGRQLKCFQFGRQYLVEVGDDHLLFVHQHRAHLRILYDRFYKSMADATPQSQQCLFPEELVLDKSENLLLEELKPELEAVGFMLNPVSEGIWDISGIPAALSVSEAVDCLKTTLAAAAEIPVRVQENLRETIALSLARRAAIRGGQLLSEQEVRSFIDQLYRCDDCQHTPDGLKIAFSLPLDSLGGKFD